MPGEKFQSAPSLRRATEPRPRSLERGRISIRALLAEGDRSYPPSASIADISIRALLAEGDTLQRGEMAEHFNFNPRPPCGGRLISPNTSYSERRFQSAPSLRRATGLDLAAEMAGFHFNPRPPCGGRLCVRPLVPSIILFQSAPSLRRATPIARPAPRRRSFQSAPSLRRATGAIIPSGGITSNFNPRPPCGGRP